MNRILIVSSSSRALADSADRAGFAFDVYDQFQDWDLQQICRRKPQSQNQIVSARDFRSMIESLDRNRYEGTVICGGFENRLDDLENLDSKIHRFGPDLETLKRLQATQSLEKLRECTLAAGGKWPESCPASAADYSAIAHSQDPNWVIKDLRGSGGAHVRRLSQVLFDDQEIGKTNSFFTIFQRFVTGEKISALYVSGLSEKGKRSGEETTISCQLIGCTEQLVGVPALGGHEFGYCGSVGPLDMAAEQAQVIAQIGQSIAEQFLIVGMFGIDFIANDEGIWPVDINPRITASAELFEIHRRINVLPPFSFFAAHVEACCGRLRTVEQTSNGLFIAKGILFCRRRAGLQITPEVFQRILLLREGQCDRSRHQPPEPSFFIADVPQLATTIPLGGPILTMFETGRTHLEARQKLIDSAESFLDGSW